MKSTITKCYYCDKEASYISDNEKGEPVNTCIQHFKYRYGG